MVTVTSGPERWLLSETRRTPVQTPVRAGVRASSLEKSATSLVKRDASGKFVSSKRAEADDATPQAAPAASAAERSTTRIVAPRANARYGSATRRGNTLCVNLGYDAFPKQQQFHESPAKYRLFGGAAGPGKSKALLMETILQAHETPGAQTLLLRRTFPELEQSLLYYFRRDVPRELYKSFNESKHVVEWQNGSTTRFGYCQNESDVYQYQGAEFLFIGIDELTLFTLRQWQFLTSRNRCPVAGSFPCMAAATNPGNIGHSWVKALWIDRQAPSGMENPDAYDPGDYDFIPARVSDNPIYAGDVNYLKTLRALPSHLRRAFLDGDWDVFAGQYFDKFDHSRHVARAEQIDWKPWWPRWISIDWGFEHPSAAYWHAAVPPGSNVSKTPSRLNTPPPLSRHPEERSDGLVGAWHAMPGADAWQDADQSSTLSSRQRADVGPDAPFASRSILRDEGPAVGFGAEEQQQIPRTASRAPENGGTTNSARDFARDDSPLQIVTYREYVTHRTPPRELARQIVERSLQSGSANSSTLSSRQRADVWPDAPFASRSILRDEGSAFGIGGEAAQQQIPRTASRAVRHRTESNSARDFARDDNCEADGAGLPSMFAGPAGRVGIGGHSSAAPLQREMTEREHIDAIYLSPDAFARRTDEASIADQMGDVFVAAGFPRPIPADNDRVGGWMLMYQMLEAGEWLLTDNCIELIRTLPNLVRDPARIEDVEKMDGDDPADAARYGLKSRYGAHHGGSGARMPLAARLAERVTSADPTVRAIQARKAQLEESRRSQPVSFVHRRR